MPAAELRRLGTSLAHKILTRLIEILASEFPTDAPRALGSIIQRIIKHIVIILSTNADETILKYACQFLQELSTHLRYIEGARSTRVPASTLTTLEPFISQIEPGARVMVRVQSSYNYEIFDIVSKYKEMFDQLLGSTLDEVLADTRSLHVVAVPAVEHSNILLHTILAHEAGHRIAQKFLESEDKQALVDKINSLMGIDLKWWDPDIDRLPPLYKLPLQQRVFDLIYKARTFALEELISDVTAYCLCGASALFALDEFSHSDALDSLPEEAYGFYPPWRYRLRQLVCIAESEGLLASVEGIAGNPPIGRIRDAVRDRLSRLKATTDQTTDLDILQNNPVLERAYRDIPTVMDTVPRFICDEIGNLRYTKETMSEEIPALLERLSLGIPPDNVSGKIPQIRSALVAGWFYRTARLPIPFDEGEQWETKHDEILSRLVSKGIESIQLLRDYRSAK